MAIITSTDEALITEALSTAVAASTLASGTLAASHDAFEADFNAASCQDGAFIIRGPSGNTGRYGEGAGNSEWRFDFEVVFRRKVVVSTLATRRAAILRDCKAIRLSINTNTALQTLSGLTEAPFVGRFPDPKKLHPDWYEGYVTGFFLFAVDNGDG